MKQPIDEQAKQKAIKMYRKGELTVAEISNLVDISVSALNKIFHECVVNGTLKPRQDTNKNKGKFNVEQEQQIAIDYYENGFTFSTLKAKWNIHPVQLQRIRNKYRHIYGIKDNAPIYLKNRKNI